MTKKNEEIYDRILKHYLLEFLYMSRTALNLGDMDKITPTKATYENVLIQSDPSIYARISLEFYEKEKPEC